jgi:hypothetical protein
MKVECEINPVEIEGDHGPVKSVQATCGRCSHTTESFGEGENSIKRCLVLLREECPRAEQNFYVTEDE